LSQNLSDKLLLEISEEVLCHIEFFKTISKPNEYTMLREGIHNSIKEVVETHKQEIDRETNFLELLDSLMDKPVERLENASKTLENLISNYGEMVIGKETSKEIVVRSQGRAVIPDVAPGTRLRVKKLLRRDGSLGGFEMIIKA
jgi:hypothetical protein